MSPATCPLCGRRRGRRACPAIGHQICAVCCGTKRLTEIQCPPDCGYLESARAHPPAVVQRQQERDAGFILPLLAGLSQHQYQLLFLVQGTLKKLAESLEIAVDDQVIRESAQALAATYETASKGIIYDHRPPSLAAERVMNEVKTFLKTPDDSKPLASERDLMEVFRRVERAAAEAGAALDGGPRAYLDLLGRLMRPTAGETSGSKNSDEDKSSSEPRVIIP